MPFSGSLRYPLTRGGQFPLLRPIVRTHLCADCSPIALHVQWRGKTDYIPDTDPGKRDALRDRKLSYMRLSDGTKSSMTPPPTPSTSRDPVLNAKNRFEVPGNAIVTGGAGALGLAVARALLEHGTSGLAIFDRTPEQNQGAIARLGSDFPSARIITKTVDVTSTESIRAAAADSWDELGPISTLLCFAGVVGVVPALEMTAEQWRQTLDINATGTFLCAQAVGGLMREHGQRGSMVFVASIAGHQVLFPQPQASYNASKAAVKHLAKCLAAEWAQYGIRVNSISPGYMDTVLNEGTNISEAREQWFRQTPMGRMGSPSEITGPVILLASEAGSFVTGADLLVDGGHAVF